MELKNKFINVQLTCPDELKDIVIALSSVFDTEGIVESENSLEFSFLTTYYKTIESDFIASFESVSDEISIGSTEMIDEVNWNEEWEKNVPAIHVNERIGIAPSWKYDELSEDIKIKIDPKMSFGSGSHFTTRLVCRLMESRVEKNSFWVDAGTGTGVLAILAVKLGAKSVYAFDYNEWSVNNTIDNLKLNNCNDLIKVEMQDIDSYIIPQCDSISANLITNVIIRSMSNFRQALEESRGVLIASGILVEHRAEVLDSAESNDFELIEELIEDEWIAFTFQAV